MSPAVLASLMCFASAPAHAQERPSAGASATPAAPQDAPPPAAKDEEVEPPFKPPHPMCPVMPAEPFSFYNVLTVTS